MKLSLPFSFSKKGISIKYRGDVITFLWPLFLGPLIGTTLFSSKNLNCNYCSFKEYKSDLSKNKLNSQKKLCSFDYSELISQWVYNKYPMSHVIILMNINVEAKNIQFWAKLPQTEMIHFLKDIVILRCKDISEMNRLVDNIPPKFADAYGYSSGSLITYNMEKI